MTTTVGELASLVRSKNAGPFWMTIDLFFPSAAAYERAAASPITDVETIAARYAIEPERVRIFRLPDLRAIKISFPRPTNQGAKDDRDMHAGQQYVPLLDINVP
jgi:uncharacterized protein DUF4387